MHVKILRRGGKIAKLFMQINNHLNMTYMYYFSKEIVCNMARSFILTNRKTGQYDRYTATVLMKKSIK